MSATPRALTLVTAAALVGLTLAWPSHTTAASGGTRRAVTMQPLSLVKQDLALAPGAPFKVGFHVGAPLSAGSTVRVTNYPIIDERRELAGAIAGTSQRGFIDTVTVSDPTMLTPDANGDVTISVATETSGATEEALQFPLTGLYPVVIDVRDSTSTTVSELVTFVDRLPDAGDTTALGSINVAVLASITAPPAMPGSNTPLLADTTSALNALAAYAPTNVPVSAAISPEVLQRTDQATLAKITTVLSHGVAMSQPRIPFDPSAAAAADQAELFTSLLVAGEATVASVADVANADRSTWFSPGPITADGAALLRGRGVRSLILTPKEYFAADGNRGDLTDFSQLFLTRLAAPTAQNENCAAGLECIPTAVVDPLLTDRLEDTTLSTEQAALYMAADLVVYRDQLASVIAPVTRHALILGASGGGVPDAQRVARMVELTTPTGAAQFTTVSNLDQTSSNLIFDGLPRDLTLKPSKPMDLKVRAFTIGTLTGDAAVVEQMLVDDNGRTKLWAETTSTLWSTAISDDQAAKTAAALTSQFDAIKHAIVPPPSYTFSLSGRATTLPLRFRNTSNEQLKIIIHLIPGAQKLIFPGGLDTVETLKANGLTDVKIRVVARTNGTFTVTLQVLAPDGRTQIGNDTILKARVSALTGLAQVLTGGALLVLLTWWARQFRRRRRLRRSSKAMVDHPTNGVSHGDGTTENHTQTEMVAETTTDTDTEPETMTEPERDTDTDTQTALPVDAPDDPEPPDTGSATLSDS